MNKATLYLTAAAVAVYATPAMAPPPAFSVPIDSTPYEDDRTCVHFGMCDFEAEATCYEGIPPTQCHLCDNPHDDYETWCEEDPEGDACVQDRYADHCGQRSVGICDDNVCVWNYDMQGVNCQYWWCGEPE